MSKWKPLFLELQKQAQEGNFKPEAKDMIMEVYESGGDPKEMLQGLAKNGLMKKSIAPKIISIYKEVSGQMGDSKTEEEFESYAPIEEESPQMPVTDSYDSIKEEFSTIQANPQDQTRTSPMSTDRELMQYAKSNDRQFEADQMSSIRESVKEYLGRYMPSQDISTIVDLSKNPGTQEFFQPGVELARNLSKQIQSAKSVEEKAKLIKQQNALAGAISLAQSRVGKYGVVTPTDMKTKTRGKMEEAKTLAEQSKLASETTGTAAQALFPRLFDAVKHDKNGLNMVASSIQDIFGLPGNFVSAKISQGDFDSLYQRMGVKPEDRRARDQFIMELGNALNYMAPSGVKASQIQGLSGRKVLDAPRKLAEVISKFADKKLTGGKGAQLFEDTVGRLGETARKSLGKDYSDEILLTTQKTPVTPASAATVGKEFKRAAIQSAYEDAPEAVVRFAETLSDGEDNESQLALETAFQAILSPMTRVASENFAKKGVAGKDYVEATMEGGAPIDAKRLLGNLSENVESSRSGVGVLSNEAQQGNIKEALETIEKVLTTDKIAKMDAQYGDNLVDITPVIDKMAAFIRANQTISPEASRKIYKKLNSLVARVRQRGGQIDYISENGLRVPEDTMNLVNKLGDEFSDELNKVSKSIEFENNALLKLEDKMSRAESLLYDAKESIETIKKSGVEPEELQYSIDEMINLRDEFRKEGTMSLTKYKSIFGDYASPAVMKKDLKAYQQKAKNEAKSITQEIKGVKDEIAQFKNKEAQRVESDVFEAEMKVGDIEDNLTSLEAQATNTEYALDQLNAQKQKVSTSKEIIDDARAQIEDAPSEVFLPFKELREAIYDIKKDVFDNKAQKSTKNAELYMEQVWKPLRNAMVEGLDNKAAVKDIESVLDAVEDVNRNLLSPLKNKSGSVENIDTKAISKKLVDFVKGANPTETIGIMGIVGKEWADIMKSNASKAKSALPDDMPKGRRMIEEMKIDRQLAKDLKKTKFYENALFTEVLNRINAGEYSKARGTLSKIMGAAEDAKDTKGLSLSKVIAKGFSGMISASGKLGSKKSMQTFEGIKDAINSFQTGDPIGAEANAQEDIPSGLEAPSFIKKDELKRVYSGMKSEYGDKFAKSFLSLMKEEGGFQKSKKDKGNYVDGKLVGTKYGISAASLDSWMKQGKYKHLGKNVEEALKNLTLVDAAKIAKSEFADKIGFNNLSSNLNDEALDLILQASYQSGSGWVKNKLNGIENLDKKAVDKKIESLVKSWKNRNRRESQKPVLKRIDRLYDAYKRSNSLNSVE